MHLRPATLFAADFEVIRPIGSGGMGSVYLVNQRSTSKHRALKVLQSRLADDPRTRTRFQREATVGAKIRSEHVVEVIAAGIDPEHNVPWLAMELLDGADLAEVVRHRGRLKQGEARVLFEQLRHGIGAAHSAGVVHRDLKPENIFVTHARRAEIPFTLKILDFGIAKLVHEAVGATDTAAVGSPLWMAPEQINAEPVSVRSDVWALGLLGFWAMTGKHYWLAANGPRVTVQALFAEQLLKPLVPASERAASLGVESLGPDFDHWFSRCVVRDPKSRFDDGNAALAELVLLLESADSPDFAESPLIPPEAVLAQAQPAALRPTAAETGTGDDDHDDSGPGAIPPAALADTVFDSSSPSTSALAHPPPERAPSGRKTTIIAAAVAASLAAGAAASAVLWFDSTRDPPAPLAPATPAVPGPVEPAPTPAAPPDVPPEIKAEDELPDGLPQIELVTPKRTQPDNDTSGVEMLGWTRDGERFVLRARHVADPIDPNPTDDGSAAEPPAAPEVRLIEVYDALSASMVESYLEGRENIANGSRVGKLPRLSAEAEPAAEWRRRKSRLKLRKSEPSVECPSGGRLVLTADAPTDGTDFQLEQLASGARYVWTGFDAASVPEKPTRGPWIDVTLERGESRTHVLRFRAPFRYDRLSEMVDAEGQPPVVRGEVAFHWSPSGDRFVALLPGKPEGGGVPASVIDGRWFIRAAGPQIRVIDGGAGQRTVRNTARTLATAGFPVAIIDLAHQPVERSEAYFRKGKTGAEPLATQLLEALGVAWPIESLGKSGWTDVVLVLGPDAHGDAEPTGG